MSDYRMKYIENRLSDVSAMTIESKEGKFFIRTETGFSIEVKLVMPSKIVTKNENTGEITTITKFGINVRTPQVRALKQESLFNGKE
jgi:hypothetical protein